MSMRTLAHQSEDVSREREETSTPHDDDCLKCRGGYLPNQEQQLDLTGLVL